MRSPAAIPPRPPRSNIRFVVFVPTTKSILVVVDCASAGAPPRDTVISFNYSYTPPVFRFRSRETSIVLTFGSQMTDDRRPRAKTRPGGSLRSRGQRGPTLSHTPRDARTAAQEEDTQPPAPRIQMPNAVHAAT